MAYSYMLDTKRILQRIRPDDLANPVSRRALFTVLKCEGGMSGRNLTALLDAIDSAMQGMVVCQDKTDPD